MNGQQVNVLVRVDSKRGAFIGVNELIIDIDSPYRRSAKVPRMG